MTATIPHKRDFFVKSKLVGFSDSFVISGLVERLTEKVGDFACHPFLSAVDYVVAF